MAGLIEKNYGDALFELLTEEKPDMLKTVQRELAAVNDILTANPELIKLCRTPSIEKSEKLGVIESAFKGRLSDYSYNFLLVVTEAGRLDCFDKINRYFNELCNERFGIADITVITTEPLSESARQRIKLKMSQVIGKTVNIAEKTDPSIIGGIVIKYGNKSFDGSVKARLEALKTEISGIIC